MSIARVALALAALSVPAASSIAQEPLHQRNGRDAVPRGVFANVGVAATDEGIVGAGHGYIARFGVDAVEFTPALGAAAPHNLPLTYRLATVARGTPVPVVAVEPTVDGTTVRYDHGPVTATYELRADGVKQSFVFHELPAGAGDLVVRGSIATGLELAHADASGVRFELPNVGGVRIGAVLGFDATGAQVQGELRHVGGELEYVLPAAFVSRAALPLIVDPLIGPIWGVSPGGFDRAPDIAYDRTTDRYLAVFRTRMSSTDQNIYGQRFNDAGLVGGLVMLETAAGNQPSDPCVANIDASDGFVVVWHQNGDIVARGVAANTGAMTGVLNVASGADVQTQPDVGGEMDETHTAAVCVWTNETTDDIQCRHLFYTPGSLLLGLTVTSFANPIASPYSAPCISQHYGASGRRMICWERFVSLGTANQALVAVVVDRNLATVAGPTLLFNNTLDERDPDCDGDGDRWVIAFEREEFAGSANGHVLAVSAHLANGTLVFDSETSIASSLSIDESDPSVGWLRESCLVAYSRQATIGGSDYDTYVRSIDPHGCAGCEGTSPLLVTPSTNQSETAIAWRLGHGADDEALIAFASNFAFVPVPQPPSIYVVAFRGDDGRVTEVQAACGTGGQLAAKCVRPGHSGFTLPLTGAAPGAVAFLALAPSRIDYPCGPCVLVPDPFVGFFGGVTVTDAVGDTVFPMPLPAAISGAAIYAQYITAGGACLGSFSLSNAILINVQ